MNPVTKWLLRWGPAILMMVLIFTASGVPGNEIPKFGWWDIFVKKGGHLIGYALLGMSWLRALTEGKCANRGMVLLAIALSAAYSGTDEFHQSLVAGRTPALSDVGIDTVGATVGALIWTGIKSFV